MKTCPRCGTQYQDANTLCPADGAVLKKEDTLIGNTLTDKYRIEEKLAEGGMGCVYRATHILMEKTVAIKVLHPALAADDKIVARFTREAKAASRISHPHALTVTDFGEDKDGVVFLVMEYLRGRTLKETIRTDGPMPLRRVVEIVRQVCGALEAAHAEGVVHRDLKSDNIMLEESSSGDWAKVLDFGIAKIKETTENNTDSALTAPNLIIGTPQYMSPEQCSQASEIDSRSDIYSLGVIIYEMLAGHVPFTGDSPTAIMMRHMQEPPPSILEERPDLPPEVGRIVARALAKQPDERYQKAGQLSDALAHAAANAPAAAPTNTRDTNPVIVPTAANAPPRATDGARLDDEDEATVFSGEAAPTAATTGEQLPHFVDEQQAPPPAQSFSPWRIALPAIAALVVVFAVVYTIQSRRSGNSNQNPQLTNDPNSQPVQPLTPPSGSAETSMTPSANSNGGLTNYDPNAGTLVNTQTLDNSNQPAGAEPTPSPAPGGGANTNTGQQEDEEDEEAAPTPQPTATPSNRNSNRRGPVVNTNTDDDDAPPPPPPAKKEPPSSSEPKPTIKTESDEAAPPAP